MLQALLVAGIAASRDAGAYALVEEARQATESLRAVLVSEAEQHIPSALKRAVGEDGGDDALLPEIERIVSVGAKSIEERALKLTRELKGGGENGLPQA